VAYLKHDLGPLRPLYDGAMPVSGYSDEPGQAMTAGAGRHYIRHRHRLSLLRRAAGADHQDDNLRQPEGPQIRRVRGDIIGVASAANCHLGQVTTAVNGKIFRASFSCLTIPATGEPDIDIATGTVATGPRMPPPPV